jgi:hypothetical protein
MSNEVVTRLPGVRPDFEQSRDPNRARLMRDLQKSEVRTGNRGQEEQAGRGSHMGSGRDSRMIKQDQPKAILRPPEKIRTPVDNQHFRNRWLKEQRDAAMAQYRPDPQSEHEQPSILPQYKTPELPQYKTPER